MNDNELIAALQAGDTVALTEMIDRYGVYVAKILRTFLGSGLTQEDLEEITSDVFLIVWNRRAGLQRNGNLKAYMAAIARNTGRKRLRKQKIVMPLSEELLSDESTPQEQLENDEACEQLRGLLGEMNPVDREIFYRYYTIRQRTAEIAKCMGMKHSTVLSRLLRGRKLLKTQLQAEATATVLSKEGKP